MTSYQCVSSDGTVVCFREAPAGRVEFFSKGESWTTSLDTTQWQHRRKSLRTTIDPEDKFPEVVHAAVHLLQFKHVHGLKPEDAKPTERAWGTHFPRMWRARYSMHNPLHCHNPVEPMDAYGEVYTRSIVAAASLFNEMTDVFRFVEPSTPNLETYGHRFRELVILGCTEVEACLRGVLQANTPPAVHKRSYTTADYFRLRDPLRLHEWTVALKDYPNMPDLTPFAQWTSAQPTGSLAWYAAYNAVKHDREGEFHRATFSAALQAMAALFVMQCAQWGPEIYSPWFGDRASPFALANVPVWEAGDFYAPDPAHPDEWAPEFFFP